MSHHPIALENFYLKSFWDRLDTTRHLVANGKFTKLVMLPTDGTLCSVPFLAVCSPALRRSSRTQKL